jgi:hypothetical protein
MGEGLSQEKGWFCRNKARITYPFAKSFLYYSKPLSHRFSQIKFPFKTHGISENRMGEGFGVRAFAL